MKFCLLALCALSLSAFAGDRNHECPVAGEVISVRDLGESGEKKTAELGRAGTAEISTEAVYKGMIKTSISRVYEDKHCVEKTYIEQQRFCENVSADLALGKGNLTFKNLYDLERNLLQRAESFSKQVKYFNAQPTAERLEIATNIVRALTTAATTSGIPRSWDHLVSVLTTAATEGKISAQVVEEITVANLAHNKKVLGFIPMTDTTIKEGAGNGKLKQIFNLDMSPSTRAVKIKDLLVGVTSDEAMALGRAFLDFASQNGIPSSWDQFALMMKSAVASGAVTQSAYDRIVIGLETENRISLGYEISAQVCKMMDVKKTQRVIETSERSVFNREVVKNYELKVVNAPLLKNETEAYYVSFDGLKAMELKVSSRYNKFSLTSQVEDKGTVKMQLQGTRLAVVPANHMKANFKMSADRPIIVLQNAGLDPKAGGTIKVRVRFLNVQIFGEKEIAVEYYDLNTSDAITPEVKIRNKKIDRIAVSIQISGSPYFGSEYSEELRWKISRK